MTAMPLEFALEGEDGQANTNWNKQLLRGHPEAATGRDELCGQCGKYLKNQQSRKHLLAGRVLNFLEQESNSSTRTPLNTFMYISCLLVSL